MPGSSGLAGGDDGGEEGNPLMDIIARFPRLPAEAGEGDHRTRLPESSSPEAEHRLGSGNKSLPPSRRRDALVAAGRGGPRLLELSPTPSPTLSRRSVRQPAFPGLSVVLLAVVAAVVWSLAAWHDSVRLARQQRPERLASRPVVSSQTASP